MAPHIDFFISNDRHHPAMVLPVARHLVNGSGITCRVLSLCELRGMVTPGVEEDGVSLPTRRLWPTWLRRGTASTAAVAGGAGSTQRNFVRRIGWTLFLGPALRRAWRQRPSAVVLPNDAAYPYDRIADLLHAKRVPFLLVQEGIRFPLPADREGGRRYGAGGAAMVAAWGEGSAVYFRRVGVPEQRLQVTGNPRLNGASPRIARPGRAGADQDDREELLLLLTNPIDDQGFCSTEQKLALVRRFVAETLGPEARKRSQGAGDLRLGLKLHAGESLEGYRAAVQDLELAERLVFFQQQSLEQLFAQASAAVVLASTVGLEALMHGLPLGVLELPGHGFAHDYVQQGAALGLHWEEPMSAQVEHLLQGWGLESAEAVAGYLRWSLGGSGDPVARVAGLAVHLAGQEA